MKIDVENLLNTVIPDIDKSIGQLELAKEGIDGISSTLKPAKLGTISRKIFDIKAGLEEIRSTLNSKAEAFLDAEAENNSLIANFIASLLANADAGHSSHGTDLLASLANLGMGVLKGAAKVIESIVDTGASVVGTAVAGVGWLGTLFSSGGDKDEADRYVDDVLKDTMSFVAKDHVGAIWDKVYSDTSVGKWLDGHAYESFRSDEIGTDIASGVGSVLGAMAFGGLLGGLLGNGALGLAVAGITTGSNIMKEEVYAKENTSSANSKKLENRLEEESYEMHKKFFQEHPEIRVTERDLDNVYEDVHYCETWTEWYQLCKENNMPPESTRGFYMPGTGKSYIRPFEPLVTYTHELNHALGDIGGNRGWNEGMTQFLAEEITETGLDENCGYKNNVRAFRDICESLNKAGYDGLGLFGEGYFGHRYDPDWFRKKS